MRQRRWRGITARRQILVMCGLLLPSLASAQQPNGPPRTITEAAEMALERYPAVAASSARVRAAESAAARAAAARWPGVQFSATATRFEEPMLTHPLHEFDAQSPPTFDETLLHANLNARYTLWDGGERGARIDQANARKGAAEAAHAARRADVLLAVTQQYARVLALQEAITAHEEREQALSEEQRRVRRLVAAGKAAQLEMIRADAAVAAAEAESVRSRTQRQVALNELARLTGAERVIDPAVLTSLRSPSQIMPARQELLSLAVEASPAIAAARREHAYAAAEVKIARSAYQPKVQLFGNYDNRSDGDLNPSGEWNVGTGISYPVFQGGARRNEVQRARAEQEVAERELAAVQLEVEKQLDAALASLQEAEARIRSLSVAVEQFRNVVRAERLSLETGVGTQTDYLAAQADLVGARAQLSEATMNKITASADVARITGQLTVHWLRETLENQK